MKENVMYIAGQAFFLILSLALTGCFGNTPPVQFYTLTPLAETGAAVAGERYGKPFSVGVGPLEIPKVLDRSQIVTRSDANRIHMAEFQRWGGTLSDDFLRVLAENLSVLLKSEQVLAYPWRDFFDPEFRVNLKMHQFDAEKGGNAVLSVTWSLSDAKTGMCCTNPCFAKPCPARNTQTLFSHRADCCSASVRKSQGKL